MVDWSSVQLFRAALQSEEKSNRLNVWFFKPFVLFMLRTCFQSFRVKHCSFSQVSFPSLAASTISSSLHGCGVSIHNGIQSYFPSSNSCQYQMLADWLTSSCRRALNAKWEYKKRVCTKMPLTVEAKYQFHDNKQPQQQKFQIRPLSGWSRCKRSSVPWRKPRKGKMVDQSGLQLCLLVLSVSFFLAPSLHFLTCPSIRQSGQVRIAHETAIAATHLPVCLSTKSTTMKICIADETDWATKKMKSQHSTAMICHRYTQMLP